jgi:hypothetical protein
MLGRVRFGGEAPIGENLGTCERRGKWQGSPGAGSGSGSGSLCKIRARVRKI